jgi:hypothetical protein
MKQGGINYIAPGEATLSSLIVLDIIFKTE